MKGFPEAESADILRAKLVPISRSDNSDNCVCADFRCGVFMICSGNSESSEEERNIFRFQDRETSPDAFFEYSPSLRDNGVPIVIDNGT